MTDETKYKELVLRALIILLETTPPFGGTGALIDEIKAKLKEDL